MNIVRSNEIYIAVFLSIIIGLSIFIITELPTRWSVLAAIGMIVPFIAIISGDIKRFLLAVLVLSLPIQLDITIQPNEHLGGPAGFMISLFDIALFALYVLWAAEIVGGKKEEVNFFSKISIPTICLVGLAFLSMINAPFQTLSLFEIKEIIKMLLGFFYIANNIKSKSDINFIVVFLILGIFLESLLGIVQQWFGRSIGLNILGERNLI